MTGRAERTATVPEYEVVTSGNRGLVRLVNLHLYSVRREREKIHTAMSDHQFLQHIVRREPALARVRAKDVRSVPVGTTDESEEEDVLSFSGMHH